MSNRNRIGKRNLKKGILAISMFFVLVFALSLSVSDAQVYSFASSSSSASITGVQYFQPGIRTYYSSSQISQYWPILSNKDTCRASTDLMIQIAPGGCTPAVVRSDLLEEQDVPVFCRLQSVKLNPSIDVTRINSIIPSLVQETVNPKNSIAGVGFHPARAALRTTSGKLLGSPVVNDIGYAVVVLKRNEIEKNMSEWVEANLTARIRYNTEKAFGIGKAEMYLPKMTDEEWGRDYVSSSFWSGKGYLRADWIEPNKAEISVYIDKDTKVSSVVLEKGKKTEDTLYLPSTNRNDYCRRGLEITLQDITYP
ncbi:hypothetical protein HYT26_05035, partial [Candidatus Pacearchaeota archaeon]|nr:hypothetical protein [Candidatus Pacearchaeota archaeon]